MSMVKYNYPLKFFKLCITAFFRTLYVPVLCVWELNITKWICQGKCISLHFCLLYEMNIGLV